MSPASPASISHIARPLRWLPWLLLCCGLTLTIAVWFGAHNKDSHNLDREFAAQTDKLTAALEGRIHVAELNLFGIRGLFAASEDVSRQEFRDYVGQLDLPTLFPGVRGIFFVKYLRSEEKSAFTEHMQHDDSAGFAIEPSGIRPVYGVLEYLETGGHDTDRHVGEDLLADPSFRGALESARDFNRLSTSNSITLDVAKPVPQSGFLLCLPVYRRGAASDTLAQRRTDLLGWVCAEQDIPAMVGTLLAREFPNVDTMLDFDLLDDGRRLVFDLDGQPPRLSARYSSHREILVGDRRWGLSARSEREFEEGLQNKEDGILLVGSGLSLLLAAAVQLLLRAQARTSAALRASAEANQQLIRREDMIKAIYEASTAAMFVINLEGRIVAANRSMGEMFGCTQATLIGSEYASHIHPAEREAGRARLRAVLAGTVARVDAERRYWRADGSVFWGQMSGRRLPDDGLEHRGIAAVITDISMQKEVEAARALAGRVLEASHEGILITDASNRIVQVNQAFTKITGHAGTEVIGLNPNLLSSGRHSPAFYVAMWQELTQYGHWEGEIWNRHHDGHIFPEWLSISRIVDRGGQPSHYVAIFSDITERKQTEERIHHLALHDYLTDLPNRNLLFERAAQTLTMARRYTRRFALIYLDLDHFKPINDAYGHDVGDALLCEVASRLRAHVRESDTVCRQGGDEFVVLLPEIDDDGAVRELACKLLTAVAAPYQLAGQELQVTVSIGLALYPEHGQDIDSLMQHADAAMYRAKRDGRNRLCCADAAPGDDSSPS